MAHLDDGSGVFTAGNHATTSCGVGWGPFACSAAGVLFGSGAGPGGLSG